MSERTFLFRAPRAHHLAGSRKGAIGRRAVTVAGLALLLMHVGGCSNSSTSPGTLTVTPATPTVSYGELVQLTLEGSNGVVDWASSDTTIAIVSRGRVWGMGVGTATITASQGGRSATTDVNVTGVPTVPTMAADIQPIFDHVCASCHTGSAPQAGIDLSDAAHSLASLILQPAPIGGHLVRSGDLEDSYLNDQVHGNAVIPAQNMPSGCSLALERSCLPISAQNLHHLLDSGQRQLTRAAAQSPRSVPEVSSVHVVRGCHVAFDLSSRRAATYS